MTIMMKPPAGNRTATTINGTTYESLDGAPVEVLDWSDFRALGQYGWRKFDPAAPVADPAAPVVMTEARKRLSALHAERDAVGADIAAIEATAQRLRSLQGKDAEISAALARLDASETAAAADWARRSANDDTLAPPKPDAALRAELNQSLAAARAGAAAAERATSSLQPEIARHAAKLGDIGKAVELVAAEVLLEEIAPLTAEIVAAERVLATVKAKFDAGRGVALRIADSDVSGERSRAIYVGLEAIHKTLPLPGETQNPEATPGVSIGDWMALVSRLQSDASAVLQ